MGEPIQFGPWPNGVDRSISDKIADVSTLFDLSGFIGSTIGSLVGVTEGVEVARFQVNTPTRWLQWQDAIVQLASKPVSEVRVYKNGVSTLLVAGDGRGAIYDNKLFIAIPGQPSRVYVDPSDLTKFAYLSEKVVSLEITSITGSAPTWTANFASTTFPAGVTPQYVMFDRDGDKNALTAKIRPVTAFSATSVTFTDTDGSLPVVNGDHVRIYLGVDANDLLKLDGFVLFRERLAGWVDNKVQFAGFPGAGTLTAFEEPNEADWTVWDALNFRIVGEESKHGKVKRVVQLDDRLICGMSGANNAVGIAHIRGYPPINALFENQTIVEFLSESAGFQSYDSVGVDRDGQALYFAYGDNFWELIGPSVVSIDDAISEHPLFSADVGYVAIVGDLVAFAEAEYRPERVAVDSASKKAAVVNQVPVIWFYDLRSEAFRPTQRIGISEQDGIKLFDSPGATGGLGVIARGGELVFAVGSDRSIYTLQDETVEAPSRDKFHLQRIQTHRHDFGDPNQKVMDEITFHVKHRFGQRLPVVVPAEGNVGISKSYVSLAKVRDTVGDLSIYSTFSRGGRGSPRLSIGAGYFAEALLAGQDRNYPTYQTTAMVSGPSTQYSQKVNLSGRVDRIDVFAADVQDLSVLIYEDNGGVPGNLLSVSPFTQPRYGLRPLPDFYWFPVDVGGLKLNGVYHIEIRGELTVRRYAGPGAIRVVSPGPVVSTLPASQFAMRVVQIIGGYYVSDEVVGSWATFEPAGDVRW